MTIPNLRPVGWNGMTPWQWYVLRELVLQVARTAVSLDDPVLMFRANAFLLKTAGRDV